MPNSYPLDWMPGKLRTPSFRRTRSQFKVTFTKARDDLLVELKKLKATNIVISSNVEPRRDGLPYSNRKNPDDPGVAVYFKSFKKDYALGCDKWDTVKDNLRAIAKHIRALRGIERWGVSSVEQSFEQFLLPTSGITKQNENYLISWCRTLGISADASVEEIQRAYRALCFKHHPDRGGDSRMFHLVTQAYNDALNQKS